jgi:hypothetical protein
MKRESAPDAIVLEQRLAAGDFFENLNGKILALEELAELSFIESGIIQEGEEHAGGGMVEENGQIFAGCGERTVAVAVVVRAGHASALLTP